MEEEIIDCNSSKGPHKRYRKVEELTPQPHKRYRAEDCNAAEQEQYNKNSTEPTIETSKIIKYEPCFLKDLRMTAMSMRLHESLPFIPGMTITKSQQNIDGESIREETLKETLMFYAIARGPGKVGVYPKSTIWDAANNSGFNRDGGKCLRCKENARGKSCFSARGFSKREDANLYVYHHRENIIDEQFDDACKNEISEANPMVELNSDWTLELLDVERQKEVRPVLCQNWADILNRFNVKECVPENGDVNQAFIQTPSKLEEFTRKIANQYKDEGKEQLQKQLRILEEEQTKIRDNLLMKIIKSGVAFGDARIKMQKQIDDTYKSVSVDIEDKMASADDKANTFVRNSSEKNTTRKIKDEKKGKSERSLKRSKRPRTHHSSKHYSGSSRNSLSYKTEKESHKRRHSRNGREKEERAKFRIKSFDSSRKKVLEKENETITKIMAGKWM